MNVNWACYKLSDFSLGTDIYTTLIIFKILTSADQDTISAVMADVKILKAVLLANVQMDMNSATMVSNL